MRCAQLSARCCAAQCRVKFCLPSPSASFRVPTVHCRQRRAVCMGAEVADLPGNLRTMVGAFQMVPDPMARYKQLLFFAAKLEGLDDSLKIEENKVQGCVSQVWVIPELREGKMYWKADSDAQLTKGLAALLVQGLSGCTPQEVFTLEPEFIEMLGLKQSLTPSRNNGFLNMFRLMQRHAVLAMQGTEESSGAAAGNLSSDPPSWEPTSQEPKPVAASIQKKLEAEFTPATLEVLDESHKHIGHAGSKEVVSPSGETHFKVNIVSDSFTGLNQVKRHRAVFGLLKDELAGPLHALSLKAKAPGEV